MSYQPQAGYAPSGGEPPLDHPWYGIGFGNAIKRGFKKYAAFEGRASRGEFWWWMLFIWVAFLVLYVLAFAVGFATRTRSSDLGTGAIPFFVLMVVFWLAVIVPSIAITVRRLHDAGYSGWFYLLNLIPSVGGLIVLILCVLQTSPMAPKYGPPVPPGWMPAVPGGYQQPSYQQPSYQPQDYPQQGYAQPTYPQVGYSEQDYAQPSYPPQDAQPQSGYPAPDQGGYRAPNQGGYSPPAPGGYGQSQGGQDQSPSGGDQQGSANPPRG